MITAFWALESDYGSGMGNLNVLRSLATLAYDCRRSEMFRGDFLEFGEMLARGVAIAFALVSAGQTKLRGGMIGIEEQSFLESGDRVVVSLNL